MPQTTKGAINPDSVPVAKLLSRYKEAKQARTKWDMNWERNYKLYVGKQWDGIEKLWFQTEPTYNKIFEFVEVMRSMLRAGGLDSWGRGRLGLWGPSVHRYLYGAS